MGKGLFSPFVAMVTTCEGWRRNRMRTLEITLNQTAFAVRELCPQFIFLQWHYFCAKKNQHVKKKRKKWSKKKKEHFSPLLYLFTENFTNLFIYYYLFIYFYTSSRLYLYLVIVWSDSWIPLCSVFGVFSVLWVLCVVQVSWKLQPWSVAFSLSKPIAIYTQQYLHSQEFWRRKSLGRSAVKFSSVPQYKAFLLPVELFSLSFCFQLHQEMDGGEGVVLWPLNGFISSSSIQKWWVECLQWPITPPQ